MRPRAPLPLRSDRSWNRSESWLRKSRIIKGLVRRVTGMVLWQQVRSVEGNAGGGALVVGLAGGGSSFGGGDDYTEINPDTPLVEQQGLASGVGVGARGLATAMIGGVPGEAAGLGMRRMADRPTFLADWEVCLYQALGSRVLLRDTGEVRLEAGLADYKDDGSDLDEGSKVRANAGGTQGKLDLYGEFEVGQRAQPAGGTGPMSTTRLEASGRATFTVDDGAGAVATITMVSGAITISTTSDVVIDCAAVVTVRASTRVIVDSPDVWLGSSNIGLLGIVAMATETKTNLDKLSSALSSHVHPAIGSPPTPVPGVIPTPIASVAAVGVRARDT